MPKQIIYSIFKTKAGYFTIAGKKTAILRNILPLPSAKKAKTHILTEYPAAKHQKTYFKPLQEQIKAYYKGVYTDFTKYPPIELQGSEFTKKVLTTCRKTPYGQTISYQQLAPKTPRPAGTVLSKNPIPLIIPCHRVIKSDGSIGNFSAEGGTSTKKIMLNLESCET